MGQKTTVYVPPMVLSVLGQKGGHWLLPSQMLKYQIVLLDQDDVELKSTTLPCTQSCSWNPYQEVKKPHNITVF